ncbi:MAG: AAA family ATPase [bacterium]
MRIMEYEYSDNKNESGNGWTFNSVPLRKINLLVGDTGTGKTRFLYTIFNLGHSIVHKELTKTGNWKVRFSINKKEFILYLEIISDANEAIVIEKELLIEIVEGIDKTIISRNNSEYIYNGVELPKLPLTVTSIYLLKDEEDVKEIYLSFSKILRRMYSIYSPQIGLEYGILSFDTFNKIKKEPILDRLFFAEYNLNVKLFLLDKIFKKEFEEFKTHYLSIFKFIDDIKVIDNIGTGIFEVPGLMPAFQIKEKNVDTWIELRQLSSGMQKVLMILIDLIIFPQGGIYLIDEYENSLGIGAINFFPDFIMNVEKDIQIIMTSHHPYIVNRIPIENWYLFHRIGSKVKIKYGDELKTRFGKSKQQSFIQLINDSFYNQGIE